MIDLKEILELSPPVALLVGLMLLGFYLKRSPFPSWVIPIALAALGAVVYPLIAEVGKVSFHVANPAILNAVFGLLIGFAASGLQGQFRNILERFLPMNGESKERNTNETSKIYTGDGPA